MLFKKEVLLVFFTSTALFLISLMVPQLSLLMLIIPFLYIRLAFQEKTYIANATASLFFVVCSFALEHPIGMALGLFLGLLPSAVALFARQDHYLEDALAKSVVMSYGSLLATQYYFSAVSGIDLYEQYKTQVDASVRMLTAQGLDTKGLSELMYNNYLVFMFGAALAISLTYFLAIWLLKKWGRIQVGYQPLYTFRFRAFSLGQFLVLMLLTYGVSSLGTRYAMVSESTMRFMMILFALQGLSVIYFFLKKYRVHPVVGTILMLFTMLMPYMNSLVSLLGFTDSMFDFRKLEPTK